MGKLSTLDGEWDEVSRNLNPTRTSFQTRAKWSEEFGWPENVNWSAIRKAVGNMITFMANLANGRTEISDDQGRSPGEPPWWRGKDWIQKFCTEWFESNVRDKSETREGVCAMSLEEVLLRVWDEIKKWQQTCRHTITPKNCSKQRNKTSAFTTWR